MALLDETSATIETMILEAWLHFMATEDDDMCPWIRCWHHRLMLARQADRARA